MKLILTFLCLMTFSIAALAEQVCTTVNKSEGDLGVKYSIKLSVFQKPSVVPLNETVAQFLENTNAAQIVCLTGTLVIHYNSRDSFLVYGATFKE